MSYQDLLVTKILVELQHTGYSQVSGYNRFDYLRVTNNGIVLRREKGTETRVPFTKLVTAIEAVRRDASIYTDGPGRLREHGITHINSPVWSLLHLLPLETILNA